MSHPTSRPVSRPCAFVGRPWTSADRVSYVDTGLASDAVAHGDFTERGGERAAPDLLRRTPDVDGLAAASDLMALGAMRFLASNGRRVPDDVAVVGYDDLGLAESTDPPLTTVRNPIVEMAEQATRLLLDQIDAGRGGRSGHAMRVIFPPSLARRASA